MTNGDVLNQLDAAEAYEYVFKAALDLGIGAGSHGIDYCHDPVGWYEDWLESEAPND